MVCRGDRGGFQLYRPWELLLIGQRNFLTSFGTIETDIDFINLYLTFTFCVLERRQWCWWWCQAFGKQSNIVTIDSYCLPGHFTSPQSSIYICLCKMLREALLWPNKFPAMSKNICRSNRSIETFWRSNASFGNQQPALATRNISNLFASANYKLSCERKIRQKFSSFGYCCFCRSDSLRLVRS